MNNDQRRNQCGFHFNHYSSIIDSGMFERKVKSSPHRRLLPKCLFSTRQRRRTKKELRRSPVPWDKSLAWSILYSKQRKSVKISTKVSPLLFATKKRRRQRHEAFFFIFPSCLRKTSSLRDIFRFKVQYVSSYKKWEVAGGVSRETLHGRKT